MKILDKYGLSASEQKIIVIVVIASSILSIVLSSLLLLFKSGDKSEMIPDHGAKGHGTVSVKKTKAAPDSSLSGAVTELDIEANMIAGVRYFESNDYEHAIAHLERVVLLRTGDNRTRCTLADAYLESGDYENALYEYDYLLSQNLPDSMSGRICARQAICQFYNSDRTESLDALRKCIAQYPTNAEAFCFLGQIEAAMQIPSDSAYKNLNKAIELDSNYVEAWYQLARYYMELKQFVKARELLLRAIDINPLHCKSQSRLGMVYYYLNSFDLAIRAYQTALALNPADFNTQYNLAEVYYAENDSAKAIRAFKKTIHYNPGHVEANFKLGLLLLANNMTKEAINHFDQAVHNDKNNTRILIQQAIAYEKLGDRKIAVSIYKSVLELDALNTIARQKLKLLSE